MIFKLYLLPLLMLLSWGFKSEAQSSNFKTFPYLTIHGEGLHSTQNEKNNIYEISVVGGFINVKPSGLYNSKTHTTRTYLTTSSNTSKIPGSNQIFLKVNDTFSIDILDRTSFELIESYKIRRVLTVPDIDILLEGDEKERSKERTSLEFKENILTASNVSLLRLDRLKNEKHPELEIEFTVKNLKTKKIIASKTLKKLESINLSSNTEYELIFNYTLQPESKRTSYIKIRPKWYENTSYYLIASFTLLSIAFLFSTKYLRKKAGRSTKALKRMEESAIRLQSLLNPHFTFNALSTIQGLINTGRVDEANAYLEDFGNLLRMSLSKSNAIFSPLDQELEMMRIYLRIEALRFNFKWSVVVNPNLNIYELEIPTLLLQPLVENAIKHGINPLTSEGVITIYCGANEQDLIISIHDNGHWVEDATVSGYGLSITQQRIETINNIRDNQNIVLNFEKEVGTKAKLTFHNWINK